MNFTVENLLETPLFSDAYVAAGKNGMDRPIKNTIFVEFPAHLIDILPKDMEYFNKDCCILLSSLYSIHDDVQKQLITIRNFDESCSSGIVLFHYGYVIKELDPKVIELCDELAFPLIIPNPAILMEQVHTVIIENLANVQLRRLLYAQEIENKFTEIILKESNEKEILDVLSSLIKKSIYFFNYNFECIAKYKYEQGSELEIILKKITDNWNIISSSNEPIVLPYNINGHSLMLYPVGSAKNYYGVLAICNSDELNDLDTITISKAVNSLSIIILNKIRKKDYLDSLVKDFMNDLTSKPLSKNEEQIFIERGLSVGVNVQRIKSIAVVDIQNFISLSRTYSEDILLKVKRDLLSIVQDQLNLFSKDSFCHSFSDKIFIAFSHTGSEEETFDNIELVANNIMHHIAIKEPIYDVTIGIGCYCHSLIDILPSFDQAMTCKDIASIFQSDHKIVFFRDMPLLSLIMNSIINDTVALSSQKLLQPLIDYDKNNNGDLVASFYTLVKNDLVLSKAADELYVHKNTMLNRRNKVIEILGRNPFASPFRLQYEIALYNVMNRKLKEIDYE